LGSPLPDIGDWKGRGKEKHDISEKSIDFQKRFFEKNGGNQDCVQKGQSRKGCVCKMKKDPRCKKMELKKMKKMKKKETGKCSEVPCNEAS